MQTLARQDWWGMIRLDYSLAGHCQVFWLKFLAWEKGGGAGKIKRIKRKP